MVLKWSSNDHAAVANAAQRNLSCGELTPFQAIADEMQHKTLPNTDRSVPVGARLEQKLAQGRACRHKVEVLEGTVPVS